MSADQACQRAENDSAIKRLAAGLLPCNTGNISGCLVRRRRLLELVSTLGVHTDPPMTEQETSAGVGEIGPYDGLTPPC